MNIKIPKCEQQRASPVSWFLVCISCDACKPSYPSIRNLGVDDLPCMSALDFQCGCCSAGWSFVAGPYGHVSDEACTRTIARVHNSSQGFTLQWFMLFILVPRCFELPHSVPASYRAQIAHISHPIRGVSDGIWWGECWLAAGLWVVFGILSWADRFFFFECFFLPLSCGCGPISKDGCEQIHPWETRKPEKENRSYNSCLGWQRGSEKLW